MEIYEAQDYILRRLKLLGAEDVTVSASKDTATQLKFVNNEIIMTKNWFDKDIDVFIAIGSKRGEMKTGSTSIPFKTKTGIDTRLTKLLDFVKMTPSNKDYYGLAKGPFKYKRVEGIYDKKNLIPIARKGITATPILLDYEGKPKFLIDGSVFPGSSGSPVFLYKQPLHSPSDGPFVTETYLKLIGILSAVFFRTELGSVEMAPAPSSVVPTVEIKEMIDLGVVLKSHLILDLINISPHVLAKKCL